jgi:hypothetical protein
MATNDNKINADSFKPLAKVCTPDPRSGCTDSRVDLPEEFAFAIATHHAHIAQLQLLPEVPEAIQIQFATAKNLCLYAWFVYRFYPVAQHQALACLEYGLRARFPDRLPKEYWNKYPRLEPTLHPLLCFAIDSGLLKNEGFRRWHERGEMRARGRYQHEQLQEMIKHGLEQIVIDCDAAVPNNQDCDWDLLSVLKASLPKTRNALAHGSTMLHNQAYGTLELVCEILNQLYPRGA